MNRPDPAFLDQITAAAPTWLRRCNGRPSEGIATSPAALRTVLAASTDVARDRQGRITWRGAGRIFTAEPIVEDPPQTPA